MKDKINTAFLALLMLFATLYPSGQAYANGLPPKVMTLIEKSDLIKKLSNDDLFFALVINQFQLNLISASNYGLLTENDKIKYKITVDNFATKNYHSLNTTEKIFLSKTIGFDNLSEFENYQDKISELCLALKEKYIELKNIEISVLNDIFSLAIKEKSFLVKSTRYVEKFLTTSDCYKQYRDCYGSLSDDILYNLNMAISGCVLLTITVVFITGGLGALAAIVGLELCILGAFGVAAYNEITAQEAITCRDNLNACLRSCTVYTPIN